VTRIEEEKRVVGWMIDMYREAHMDVEGTSEKCEAVKEYAFNRLSSCKFGENKTTCQKCPVHCYKPEMRESIREIMRYSGPRMIFRHPIAAIKHLLREL